MLAKHPFQAMMASLGALAFISFLQLVTRPEPPSAPHVVSLYCFAASVPILGALAVMDPSDQPHPLLGLAALVGSLVAIVGIGGLFWHYGVSFGLVYAGASVTAIAGWFKYLHRTQASRR